MASGSLLLGIDVSTTGAKALLIDSGGQVVASATTPLTLSTPRPLWSEQAPEDWYAGVANSIREALRKAGRTGADVAAVGLTGQMHGLVVLDEAGAVLRPAILWTAALPGRGHARVSGRLGRGGRGSLRPRNHTRLAHRAREGPPRGAHRVLRRGRGELRRPDRARANIARCASSPCRSRCSSRPSAAGALPRRSWPSASPGRGTSHRSQLAGRAAPPIARRIRRFARARRLSPRASTGRATASRRSTRASTGRRTTSPGRASARSRLVQAGRLPVRRAPLPPVHRRAVHRLVTSPRRRVRRPDGRTAGLHLAPRGEVRPQGGHRADARLRDAARLDLRRATAAADRHRARPADGARAPRVAPPRSRVARRDVRRRRPLVAVLARVHGLPQSRRRRDAAAADTRGGDGAPRVRRRRDPPVRCLRRAPSGRAALPAPASRLRARARRAACGSPAPTTPPRCGSPGRAAAPDSRRRGSRAPRRRRSPPPRRRRGCRSGTRRRRRPTRRASCSARSGRRRRLPASPTIATTSARRATFSGA